MDGRSIGHWLRNGGEDEDSNHGAPIELSRIVKAEIALSAYYFVCSVLIALEGTRAPISWTVWTLLYVAGTLELAGLAKGVRIVMNRLAIHRQ